MKLIVVVTIAVALATTISGKSIPGNKRNNKPSPDENPLPDNYYRIESAYDGLLIAAFDQGYWGGRLGRVSTEQPKPDDNADTKRRLVWDVYKPYYPPVLHPPDKYGLTRMFSTRSANMYNNIQIELDNSFPTEFYFSVIQLSEELFEIKALPEYDWGGKGQNTCLKNNGLGLEVEFAECDKNDVRQHWKFNPVPADELP